MAIMHLAGLPSHRRPRLSSNVRRHHSTPLYASLPKQDNPHMIIVSARTRVAATGIALALAPILSPAQRMTGSALLEACESRLDERPGFNNGLCLGAIVGALDAHDRLLSKEDALYCLGDRKITNDQVVRIVVKWLKANPDQLNRSGAAAVIFALRSEFQCVAPEAKQ